MTRDQKHIDRILTADPDTLGTAEFIERRQLMQARRRVDITAELRCLGPCDMTRRHRRNHLHPKARREPWDGKLRSRNVYGIPRELTPPEGLTVASANELADALKTGEIGRMTSVTVMERTP